MLRFIRTLEHRVMVDFDDDVSHKVRVLLLLLLPASSTTIYSRLTQVSGGRDEDSSANWCIQAKRSGMVKPSLVNCSVIWRNKLIL